MRRTMTDPPELTAMARKPGPFCSLPVSPPGAGAFQPLFSASTPSGNHRYLRIPAVHGSVFEPHDTASSQTIQPATLHLREMARLLRFLTKTRFGACRFTTVAHDHD